MKQLINASILSLALVSAFNANAHTSNGSMADGFTMEGTLNNPLVCGVVIGDGTQTTITSGVTVGADAPQYTDEIKFLNNSGKFNYVKISPTVTLDPNLTGEAANLANYKLIIEGREDASLDAPIQFITGSSQTYKLGIRATNLTIADFPYSDDLSIDVSFDILCE